MPAISLQMNISNLQAKSIQLLIERATLLFNQLPNTFFSELIILFCIISIPISGLPPKIILPVIFI
jgi:hypothetical protein